MKTKTKPKTKLKSKPKNSLRLEFEGQVMIVNTEKGKTTRTELPGEVVLNCVMEILSQSVRGK